MNYNNQQIHVIFTSVLFMFTIVTKIQKVKEDLTYFWVDLI